MKNLIKTIFRSLFAKKLQTFILLILLTVSGILFSYAYTAVSVMNKYNLEIKQDSNLEDLRFMIKPGEEKKVIDLEKKYNIDTEEYESKFLQEEWQDKTINIYATKERQNIDKAIYIDGESPSSDDEIAIFKNFAEENNIGLKDKFSIKEKEYTVTGIFISADKLTIYDTSKSVNINTSDNCMAILNGAAFKEIDSSIDKYYCGVFKEDDLDKRAEISNIADEEYIIYAISSEDYSEVTMLDSLIKSNKSLMTYGMGLLVIIIIIVALIELANSFKSFLKPIGVLIAIGCSRVKIVLSYLCYSIVFAVPIILGLLLGYMASDSFLMSINKLYNINITKVNVGITGFLECLIGETLILTLSVLLMVTRSISKDAMHLIKSNEKQSVNIIYIYLKKLISIFNFSTRVKLSIAMRKPGRFVLGILVFFISYNLFGSAFAIKNSTSNITKNYADYLNFKEVYYYKTIKNGEVEEDSDKFISTGVKLIKNETTDEKINYYYTLEGIDCNQESINLTDEKENELIENLTSGVVIPKIISIKHHISEGDKLKLNICGIEKDIEVSGINSSVIDEKIYIDINELYDLGLYKENDYTGVYVKNTEAINEEDQDINYSLSKDNLIDISKKFGESTKGIESIMFISSVLISVLLIVLISAFNFNDNIKNVALLNFIGYSKRKTNDMIVNVLDSTALVGSILGVLTVGCFLKNFENILLTASNYPLTFELSLNYKIISLMINLALYALIKLLCNLVLNKGSIVDILRKE
ncbi:MAG: FtsX-like permease family protein [Clostridium sp.]|nr:FtsX-like permease family protein [Clostridium sp.]